MVIVGGLGSIIGSCFGAAFILLLPGQIHTLIAWAGQRSPGAGIGVETLAHIPHAVYGALIIIFLLVEPMGLGKLYAQRAQLPDRLAVRLRQEIGAADDLRAAAHGPPRNRALAEQRRGHLRPRRAGHQGRVDRRCPRAAWWRCSAPTAPARARMLKAISGLLAGRARRGHARRGAASWAATSTRCRRRRACSCGIVQVLEGRRVFEHLTPDENLVAASAVRGSRADMQRNRDRGLQLLSAAVRAPHARSRVTCRAASSRCWPSAAR